MLNNVYVTLLFSVFRLTKCEKCLFQEKSNTTLLSGFSSDELLETNKYENCD